MLFLHVFLKVAYFQQQKTETKQKLNSLLCCEENFHDEIEQTDRIIMPYQYCMNELARIL